MNLLCGPEGATGLRRDYYRTVIADRSVDATIRKLMVFHTLDMRSRPHGKVDRILPLFADLNPDPVLPAADVMVEDAGLYDHGHVTQQEI